MEFSLRHVYEVWAGGASLWPSPKRNLLTWDPYSSMVDHSGRGIISGERIEKGDINIRWVQTREEGDRSTFFLFSPNLRPRIRENNISFGGQGVEVFPMRFEAGDLELDEVE
jgi:hypothetical protein